MRSPASCRFPCCRRVPVAFLDQCWGIHYFPESRTLDQHIAKLRKRIDTDPDHPLIETVRGVALPVSEEGMIQKGRMVTTKSAKLPENQGMGRIGPNTRKVDLAMFPTL